MNTTAYTCPCCGGPLAYNGESGKLECAACGNSYDTEALEMLNPSESELHISFDRPADSFQADENGV